MNSAGRTRVHNVTAENPDLRSAVIVRLLGGLGNQMFQYAMARTVALRSGLPVVLDTASFALDSRREFALDVFEIEAALADPEKLGGSFFPLNTRLPRRFFWLPQIGGAVKLFRERGYTVDRRILNHVGAGYFDGYWQSYRYFSEFSDIIRKDFTLKRPLSSSRQGIAESLLDRPAISVHVRRGDYVSNPIAAAYHGTCPPEWYATAIAEMLEQANERRFVVFSDDSDWARENLPKGHDMDFVEPADDGRDCEDLHLMSLCRHHIIANSSFSWWGAWLNPRTDKRVIAPRNWFASAGHDIRDLLPEEWMKL